jgi:hypothetical protein
MSRKLDPKKTKKQNWMWLERVFYLIDDLDKRLQLAEKRLDVLEKKPSCCKSTEEGTSNISEYGIDNHLKNHFDEVIKSIKAQQKKK